MPVIQALPNGEFWFWAITCSLLALIAIYFAFRNLVRARVIEDIPTSRIRSAHQGYVELNGAAAAMQGEPILSPLTHIPCCWFRYRIERRHDKGWRTVKSGKSEGLFLIKDDTGECIIDPDGADITPNEKNVWYGSNSFPTNGPGLGAIQPLGLNGILGLNTKFSISNSHYRYTEETIYPGDPLYAIGLFKSFGETDRLLMQDDLIKARLSQWKADNTSLLSRFDRDGDGKIDLSEWEVARRTAKHEVSKEQCKPEQQPIHTLSQTSSRYRPFLISSHAEFSLVKRFRYFAFGSLLGFMTTGVVAAWLFTSRFVLS